MRPLPVKLAVIAACLPLVAYPALLSRCPADSPAEIFVYLYPVYVVLSGVCAWQSWPARKEVFYILIALLLLTHAAMWALVSL